MSGIGKQAKILSKGQIEALLAHAAHTRNPTRNRLIILLSVRAALRAIEIASLTWGMVLNADGTLADTLSLTNNASKGQTGGREIPLSKGLKRALSDWFQECGEVKPTDRIIRTKRSATTSPRSSSTCSPAFMRIWDLSGAPAIRADAPSSPMPPDGSQPLVDLFGMSSH